MGTGKPIQIRGGSYAVTKITISDEVLSCAFVKTSHKKANICVKKSGIRESLHEPRSGYRINSLSRSVNHGTR